MKPKGVTTQKEGQWQRVHSAGNVKSSIYFISLTLAFCHAYHSNFAHKLYNFTLELCLRDFLLRNFLGTKQKWLEISLSKIVMFAWVCFLVPWQHFPPLHLLKPKNSRGKKRIKVLCVFADKYQQAGDWLRKLNLDKLESKTALNAFKFVHNYADNDDKYPANRDVSANWINPK